MHLLGALRHAVRGGRAVGALDMELLGQRQRAARGRLAQRDRRLEVPAILAQRRPALVPEGQEQRRAARVARLRVAAGAVLRRLVAARGRDGLRAGRQRARVARAAGAGIGLRAPVAAAAAVPVARLGVAAREGAVGALRVVEVVSEYIVHRRASRPAAAHDLRLEDLDVLPAELGLGLGLGLGALHPASLRLLQRGDAPREAGGRVPGRPAISLAALRGAEALGLQRGEALVRAQPARPERPHLAAQLRHLPEQLLEQRPRLRPELGRRPELGHELLAMM
eukprot:COSAG06_NODE_1457_length_9417_cov_58.780425_5_plen_281_part_00